MKISLSLISVGMIAAAATAESTHDLSFFDYNGTGLQVSAPRSKAETVTTLFSTDFNSYTVGNVCTDLTAGTPGQGGWWAFNTTSTTFQTFTIVTNAGGKALKSQWGTNAAGGGTSYLWQDNGGAGFAHDSHGGAADRITEIDFNLTRFANTQSNNKGQTQLRTWDASGTFTTMGFIFDNYATGTQPSVRGLAYLGGPGVTSAGTYAFTLTTGSTILAAGARNYYCAYDKALNQVQWGWDGVGAAGYYFDLTGYDGGTVMPDINEMDFLTIRNTATIAGNMVIDDVWFGYSETPAPGAVALLGLAGVAARRRRA